MASPVTIQPATFDTYLQENLPNSNYATDTVLKVGPLSGSRTRSILKFDFSSVVPSNATITSAVLSLMTYVSFSSRTLTVYRLLRTDVVPSEMTWNVYKTGSNWGTAGALNTSTDITTADAVTFSSGFNLRTATVTAQVQTALNSVGRVAYFLMADMGASATGANQYCSSEYTETTWRPQLTITYTVPTPSSINIGDANKAIDWAGSKINIGDTWKTVVSVKVNVGGTWKDAV